MFLQSDVTSIASLPPLQVFVRVLKFFAVCYGLRFANLQEFLPSHPVSFKVVLYYTGCPVSQFLHSLNVNPCTPTVNIQYAKKFLMAAHKSLECWQTDLAGYHLQLRIRRLPTLWGFVIAGRRTWNTRCPSPTLMSKILTPYGGTEKNSDDQ